LQIASKFYQLFSKFLENAATPYSATVVINGINYGEGFGTSKKLAKSEAARETLEIFIPAMREKIKPDNKGRYTANDTDLNVGGGKRI
jgi:microprocessor complex subunit DGCR8